MYQKSNKEEIEVVWGLYLGANDRWKELQAKQNAKLEIKVHAQGCMLYTVSPSFYMSNCLNNLIFPHYFFRMGI